jgi:uncharacterized protein DUF2764
MDKYYYLAAQLPILEFDTAPALTRAAFLKEASKWLSPGDLASLRSVHLDTTTAAGNEPPALRAFILHELRLRTELAQWRRARRESHEYKPGLFSASQLLDSHPLAAEKALLRLRWNLIEELQFGHYSDIEFLVLYHLKLQILERLQSFDRQIGEEKFFSYTETNS